MRTGTGVTGTTAGTVGVTIAVTVGVTTGEGVIGAGGALMEGAIRVVLEGADKLAKSAGDSRLSVAR